MIKHFIIYYLSFILYSSSKFDEYAGNFRKKWNFISDIRNHIAKDQAALSAMLNNEISSDPKEVAEGFNEYFSEVEANPASQIPRVQTDFRQFLPESAKWFIKIIPSI